MIPALNTQYRTTTGPPSDDEDPDPHEIMGVVAIIVIFVICYIMLHT